MTILFKQMYYNNLDGTGKKLDIKKESTIKFLNPTMGYTRFYYENTGETVFESTFPIANSDAIIITRKLEEMFIRGKKNKSEEIKKALEI
jgi:hypothetical protein